MKLHLLLLEGSAPNFLRIMKIRIEIEGRNAGCINYRGQSCFEPAVNYLNSIEADEVLVYIDKEDGTKASAEFEGEYAVESAANFIHSNMKSEVSLPSSKTSNIEETRPLPLKERLELFLKFEYKDLWFTSMDVKKRYEAVYGKIGLSTVSTYLARMCRENKLIKRGNRNHREYKFEEKEFVIQTVEQTLVK